MNEAPKTHPFRIWIMAIRPKTLPAAVSPVLAGTAAAIMDGRFSVYPALVALFCALLLQIGVNLANDYFDFRKQVDTEERLGPIRVTQSGLIAPERVRDGMILTFGLAVLAGLYLVKVGGWPILLIGGASILASMAYSGGPFTLASNGFGDLLVFIFFGLVAVCGTYYVQALLLTSRVVLISVPIGLLITAILVVNNLRDIPTDQKAGKYTLAVRLGEKGTRIEYVLLIAGAYGMPILLFLAGMVSAWALLPLLSLPMAVIMIRAIYRRTGRLLNKGLAETARLALVFSLLLSVGLTLG